MKRYVLRLEYSRIVPVVAIKPQNAHLVGSVPLSCPEEVFFKISGALGPYLTRLPDGETGHRADWIGFVRRYMGRNPAFEKDESMPLFQFKQWNGKVVGEWPLLKFLDEIDIENVRLETGYAEDAIASFGKFAKLQDEGIIPSATRYQTCSATPHAISYMYITPNARKAFTRLYTKHLIAEVEKISMSVPHDKLSYQWDVCQEVLMWEGYFEQYRGYKNDIIQTLARVGNAVEERIDMGYHLCYGSPLDEHCIQPADMGNLVEITNALMGAVSRRIDFIHLPVPKDRNDEAYFAPLANLRLPSATSLYLGCVHHGDHGANAHKLNLASRHIEISGIGSECGWGRGNPEDLDAILASHCHLLDLNRQGLYFTRND